MTADKDDGELEPQRHSALTALLADLPDSYPERYAAIQKIRHAFHRQIAALLTAPLNEQLAGMPQDTILECQELSAWINQQLRDIGLAVICPNTKRPATLVVDRQDREHPDITRFRFSIRSDSNKSCYTAARRTLPTLDLMEHAPRIEGLSRSHRMRRRDSQER